MKSILLTTIFILFILQFGIFAQEDSDNPFTFELCGGIKAPINETADDISAGLAFRLGLGYMLTKNIEIAHLAAEFGSSTPHDPDMLVIQDYYSYYGRVAMEKVLMIGAPLTTRFHFNINEYFDGFVGGGGAWYWFSTRLEDPIYGELKEPRSRKGFGGLIETGISTNVFSENVLASFKVDYVMLNTNGKTLSIKNRDEIDSNKKRMDNYLTFSIGIRYALK